MTEKLYNLFVRMKDGTLKKLTRNAMPHPECCTMKSKFSEWSQSRIIFVVEDK